MLQVLEFNQFVKFTEMTTGALQSRPFSKNTIPKQEFSKQELQLNNFVYYYTKHSATSGYDKCKKSLVNSFFSFQCSLSNTTPLPGGKIPTV